MRRKERHHLKVNPLAVFISGVQDVFVQRRRTLGIGLVIVMVGLISVGAYSFWLGQESDRAGSLLAAAMAIKNAEVLPPPDSPIEDQDSGDWEQPPNTYPSEDARRKALLPRLLATADEYPSTPQGITARFQAATTLVSLGRFQEAEAQYQMVIGVDAGPLYGQMARLGLAESHLLSGDHAEAILLFEGATGTTDSPVPVDAVLMRLGLAYQLAGQDSDALAAYTRVVEEFPQSLYVTEARRESELIRGLSSTTSGG